MHWFLAKIVYRIICGDGAHTAQFDEQLRLIAAPDAEEAYRKATRMGTAGAETFFNQYRQLVEWRYINVPELYPLTALIDGAELYSRINEVEDAETYTTFIHRKAEQLQQQPAETLFNLI